MVDSYSDLVGPDDRRHDVIGQHCINCGEYVDRLVHFNRRELQGVVSLQLQLFERIPLPRRTSSRLTSRQRAAGITNVQI